MTVRVDQPERMNILGLLMQGLLTETLKQAPNSRKAGRMRGDVFVQAGQMGVTLRFDGSGIVIIKGASDRPRARVRGGMTDLLAMVTGAGVIAPVLAGRVRISGNPFFLLRMLPLIQAPQ